MDIYIRKVSDHRALNRHPSVGIRISSRRTTFSLTGSLAHCHLRSGQLPDTCDFCSSVPATALLMPVFPPALRFSVDGQIVAKLSKAHHDCSRIGSSIHFCNRGAAFAYSHCSGPPPPAVLACDAKARLRLWFVLAGLIAPSYSWVNTKFEYHKDR